MWGEKLFLRFPKLVRSIGAIRPPDAKTAELDQRQDRLKRRQELMRRLNRQSASAKITPKLTEKSTTPGASKPAPAQPDISAQLSAIEKRYQEKIQGLSERVRQEVFAEASHIVGLCSLSGQVDVALAQDLLLRGLNAKEAGAEILRFRAAREPEISSRILGDAGTGITSRGNNPVVKACQQIAEKILKAQS